MDFIIISVGNELLSGDTANSNSVYMAKKLVQMGHRVKRIIVIPDDVDEIAEEVRKASEKADFVLVTGGLGATHDDVTAEGIAKAFNVELVVDEKTANRLRRFSRNEEAIRKVASVPKGSEIIPNDRGAAPAFIFRNVAVMPGVPAEMEDTFNKIIKRFSEEEYYEDTLKVNGYESQILKELNKVVEEFKDVSIGSYPKPGYVVIKFSGRNKGRVEEAKKRLEELLKVRK
ncbi:competence/damage-inducible protein cinA [Archaeoglobus sulfaticallidus PM70-1]|uniref:Competence/damage-inducible protein cinA n=1 Tax=Archaeoglobus sulfaticallidus PM70-1 TaxID=387631 RepID=N0BCP4_9EURY|nr:molybdopterin-binding protein [Archaeoglobus sulfaticallidus]AGK60783.1 competence/damage-inducible protein cinA [Archaeoglobus sulfaticallidus PM70-1]